MSTPLSSVSLKFKKRIPVLIVLHVVDLSLVIWSERLTSRVRELMICVVSQTRPLLFGEIHKVHL